MVINKKIAIIGLGYVGLPLAVEFGKKYKTIGYDLNKERIAAWNEIDLNKLLIIRSISKKSKFHGKI